MNLIVSANLLSRIKCSLSLFEACLSIPSSALIKQSFPATNAVTSLSTSAIDFWNSDLRLAGKLLWSGAHCKWKRVTCKECWELHLQHHRPTECRHIALFRFLLIWNSSPWIITANTHEGANKEGTRMSNWIALIFYSVHASSSAANTVSINSIWQTQRLTRGQHPSLLHCLAFCRCC